jgi:hypothetical protein
MANTFVGLSNDPSNNSTAGGMSFISDPSDSNRATVMRNVTGQYRNDGSNPYRALISGGQRLAQSSIDSIRFYTGSGNISSGIFSVYAVTESGGGAKNHIQTIDANDQSSVDFTNIFASDDGYARYQIYGDNIIPSSDGVELQVRMSSDGGSSWDSGSSDYAWSLFYNSQRNNSAGVGSSGDSKIDRFVLSNMRSDVSSSDTAMFKALISNPTNSSRSTVIRNNSSIRRAGTNDDFLMGYSGGIRLAQSAVDSIQFFVNSGNISSGTFSVYGVGQ